MWRATAQQDASASLSSTTIAISYGRHGHDLTFARPLAPAGSENDGRRRTLLLASDVFRRLSGTTLAQFSAVGRIVARVERHPHTRGAHKTPPLQDESVPFYADWEECDPGFVR